MSREYPKRVIPTVMAPCQQGESNMYQVRVNKFYRNAATEFSYPTKDEAEAKASMLNQAVDEQGCDGVFYYVRQKKEKKGGSV